MEITKKNRRDYDKPARNRREYDSKPSKFSSASNSSRGRRGAARDEEPFSEHKPRTEGKPFGERKPRTEAGKGFGTFKGADRKSYGDGKPSGERRSYGEGKPFGEHKPYGAGKPFAKKSAPKKAEGPATEVRLNKFIANSGICSRREADRLIQAGVVTVNGVVVTELGSKVNVRKDVVLFGDQKLKGEDKVYIVMNKPKGFVTTTSDPHADQTVMDLLTKCPARVFPVGRLDKNTTGVLLFTNDGELSEKLTHPSFNKKKIYEATLDKKLSQEDFDRILSGINLEDGPIKADELNYVNAEDKRVVGIEIHSGKNRIVRRIFESLGYQVKGLDRVYFAGMTKKGIKRGQWRYMTEGEVNLLKMGAFN